MVKRTMLLVVVVSLSCGLLLAHDMWLESSSFLMQPGEIVTIRNGNGTIYSKSENAVAPGRIAALKGMSPSGEALRLGEPGVDGDWLALDFRPREAGTYWIGLATKPRQIRLSGGDFNDYLEHDGIPQALIGDGRVLVLLPQPQPLPAGTYIVRVAEGAAPYGSTVNSISDALKRASLCGMPVVKVGRGNAEGFTPRRPNDLAIAGSNLTATKARVLLMACLMKLGCLPPAADTDHPTRTELDAIQAKLAEYQKIFDTH